MNTRLNEQIFAPIADEHLLRALNELSRSINISTTYGRNHPAALSAVDTTLAALNNTFSTRAKLVIGAFNGNLTIDENPTQATGTLLIALERRLSRLRITGLKLERGINKNELRQLIELLAVKDGNQFRNGISQANLDSVSTKDTEYIAIQENEVVADKSEVGNISDNGFIVLDDTEEFSKPETPDTPDIKVDKIVAFLEGNTTQEENEELIGEAASDPDKLAKLIMDSVAIRQSMNEFSGESLGDIVLGCLRKTFDGLRESPKFKSEEGKASLQKALLMLEENILIKLRGLTRDNDPELDRQIVQTIREMNDQLGFEVAAMKYSRHAKELEKDKEEMMAYAADHGQDAAESLINNSDVSLKQWQKIVVENEEANLKDDHPVSGGLETLTTVFENLESVIRSTELHDGQVKDLLGKANENLDDTIDTTREKLDVLSRQLQIAKAGGTIGGQGRNMDQRELLAALAEVAQELMQPITAITASLEMMLHGFVGDITEEQRDLLEIAGNSGEHLKYLMKELIDIVGCPANKGVDERFHTTSDEIAQLKDAEGQEHLNLGYFQ